MKERYNKTAISLEAGLSLILMAGVPVFIKFTSANPYTIGIFRLSIATLLILLLVKPAKHFLDLSYKKTRNLALIGIIFSVHWLTYFFSIKMATASIGMLGASTYGIHLIFLGWIIQKNRPSVYDIIAIALALTGTYLIIPELSLSNNITAGLLLAVLSGFCFALLPVIHQKNQHLPESLRTFGQFFFALVVFVFFIPATKWQFNTSDWLSLLYLAVLGTFIAHTLWIRVTTQLPTTITSIIFYLIIPITMLISHYWLGEDMGVSKVSGATLVVTGNLLGFYGRFRKSY